jgi:hypothetical protein
MALALASADAEPSTGITSVAQLAAILEQTHREAYEPDQDPFEFVLDGVGPTRLITAQHLAAARALVTARAHGVNDDYLANRQSAYSLGTRLQLERDSSVGRGLIWISAKAVHGFGQAIVAQRVAEPERRRHEQDEVAHVAQDGAAPAA